MKVDTHEEWRIVRDTNERYSVSNLGRVKNNETGLVLSPVDFGKGYVKVNLPSNNGCRVNRQVHRLVAIAFIPNPENKPEVNHINGIHDDNRVENLEWVSGEENRHHAYETGLVKHKDERFSGYLHNLWCRRKSSIREWCDEWQVYLNFYDWCMDNGYCEGDFIALKDAEKGYRPDNCYITNKKTSVTKRRELYIKYMCFGEELTINEICSKYGIQPETLKYRLKKGMPVEQAATTPLNTNGRPRKEII